MDQATLLQGGRGAEPLLQYKNRTSPHLFMDRVPLKVMDQATVLQSMDPASPAQSLGPAPTLQSMDPTRLFKRLSPASPRMLMP